MEISMTKLYLARQYMGLKYLPEKTEPTILLLLAGAINCNNSLTAGKKYLWTNF